MIITELTNNKEGSKKLYFLKYLVFLKFQKKVKYWRTSDLEEYPYVTYFNDPSVTYAFFMNKHLTITEKQYIVDYKEFIKKFLNEK